MGALVTVQCYGAHTKGQRVPHTHTETRGFYTIGYPKVDTIRIGVESYMGECFTSLEAADRANEEEGTAEYGYKVYEVKEVERG
jgi:hypothetical protein